MHDIQKRSLKEFFIDRGALAKQGDKWFGSTRLSASLCTGLDKKGVYNHACNRSNGSNGRVHTNRQADKRQPTDGRTLPSALSPCFAKLYVVDNKSYS